MLLGMDQDAREGLRALLAILNRQNVNREVDRLFRPSASSTGPSVSTSVPVTTMSTFSSASTASSQSLRDLGPIFSPRTVSVRRQGRGILDHTLTRRLQAINLPELLFFWRVRQRRTCHVGGSGKPYGTPDAKVESVFARG